jgi:hypothetical protein
MVIPLDRGLLVIADTEQAQRMLGAPVPATPSIAAYALTVADLAATRRLLAANKVFTNETAQAILADGGPALGATIAFLPEAAKAPWE